MDLQNGVILLLTGLLTGFINTVAGGGSLLTLPVLIFLPLELSAAAANATNRVAVLFQSMSAMYGFRRQGVRGIRTGLWLGVVASAGAVLGTYYAINIDDEHFKKVLAIIMFVVSAFIILEPFFKKEAHEAEKKSAPRTALLIVIFFFIGVYGGFVQAGVGFVIIAALSIISKMNLVKINNVKVVVVLVFTLVSLGIFAYSGLINWRYGLVLAVGQSAGGLAGSIWSVKKGEKWIRRLLLAMIVIMALKLLGVPFLNPGE